MNAQQCQKVCFENRHRARQAARKVARAHGTKRMRVYYCPACDNYHLTSHNDPNRKLPERVQ